jgi:hypothetical protein
VNKKEIPPAIEYIEFLSFRSQLLNCCEAFNEPNASINPMNGERLTTIAIIENTVFFVSLAYAK